MGTIQDRNRINFSWLLRLRWWSIVGQCAVILGAQYVLKIELPQVHVALVLLAEIITNVGAQRYLTLGRKINEGAIALLLMTDVVLLTALLYATGGPHNPFTFLYVVSVSLSAVVLPTRWTWPLAVLSFSLFGLLFYQHIPLQLSPASDGQTVSTSHQGSGHHGSGHHGSGHHGSGHHGSGHHGSGHHGNAQVDSGSDDAPMDHMSMHLMGMWLAFGLGTVFIVYFVSRVRNALAERDAQLSIERERVARNDKLVALGALAGGAAHELSTPLSTIAVVAKELSLNLEKLGVVESHLEDVKLIRTEVDRCHTVLREMSADAGEHLGEMARDINLSHLLSDILSNNERFESIEYLQPKSTPMMVFSPQRAAEQVIKNVLSNALDATAQNGHVTVQAHDNGTYADVCVTDTGVGMTEEGVRRATEPFYTTKPTGRGLGLGLFLTQSFLDRIGGKLVVQSTLGEGTTVTLRFPKASSNDDGISS